MVDTIKSYLSAKTLDEAMTYFSEDYLLYFYSKESKGINKGQLRNILDWDYALNPQYEIFDLNKGNNTLHLILKEENDFSKALGFPGWQANVTFAFNEKGLIKEQLYFPLKDQPNHMEWLLPVINWLKKEKPEELNEIINLKTNELIHNSTSALKWVQFINLWKAEKVK